MSCDCAAGALKKADVVAAVVFPSAFPTVGSVIFRVTAVLRLSPRKATSSTAG